MLKSGYCYTEGVINTSAFSKTTLEITNTSESDYKIMITIDMIGVNKSSEKLGNDINQSILGFLMLFPVKKNTILEERIIHCLRYARKKVSLGKTRIAIDDLINILESQNDEYKEELKELILLNSRLVESERTMNTCEKNSINRSLLDLIDRIEEYLK